MLNIDKTKLKDAPFPHLVQRELFEPEFYRSLKSAYPDFNRAAGWSRMSKDLMRGDEYFSEVVSDGPWKIFFDYINSSEFLGSMVDLFQSSLHSNGLAVNPASLKMTDHIETREWIATHKVSQAIQEFEGDKEEVFVRMDFGVGEKGYNRPPHIDWRHRICSLLVYFDDPSETQMDGGRFIINGEKEEGYPTINIIEPENNMGIFKVDNNHSFHSVNEISAIEGQRKTLYIPISSRGQIWPSMQP